MTDSSSKKRKTPGVKLGISLTQEQMDWLTPYAEKHFYGKISRALQNLVEGAKDREAYSKQLVEVALGTPVSNLTDYKTKMELVALDTPNDRMAAECALDLDLRRIKGLTKSGTPPVS
jgi:hypothetical protein